MKSAEKLVMFMEKKADIIAKKLSKEYIKDLQRIFDDALEVGWTADRFSVAVYNKYKNMFFNAEDRKELLELPDDVAERLYMWLAKTIIFKEDGGVQFGTCIFSRTPAETTKGCEKCKYGVRHGRCFYTYADHFSDYGVIWIESRKYGINLPVEFSNSFYVKLIEELEKNEGGIDELSKKINSFHAGKKGQDN